MMRVLGATIFMSLMAVAVVSARPEPVRACVGSSVGFEDAIRLSDGAIYAGRVTRAEIADTFWIDLTVDIDIVVRGPATTEVPRAQAGSVCDGIREGEWGYIVRGFHNPQDPRTDNLFFRISSDVARPALVAAGLPDTSTVTILASESPRTAAVPLLAVVFFAALLLSAWRLGARSLLRAVPSSGDIPGH